ncbi:kinase domain protein (macronuclear) [Tetrahymena thermophila SB210]|uniref:Kinase domain protein n=1 Tax=Tetrahymena thermophila (strain SB210) TaxID=312017 RepID=Q22P80_TETTS|nr:kinase domain protein [Tetrahymena thermophila SB210]EAR87229.3 kinase domain protein [Tetrahymena thermophila SB210]|eukprot:XP_001007474.3 kinase domain protein [Tetrahymena thermophila SB210]
MYLVQRQELLNCKQQFQILYKQSIHDFLKTFGYVYEKEISRSSSSLVVQAKSLKNNNSKVAIKILNYEYNSKINIQKLKKQVEFLDSLKGEKYVLQFIEIIQDLTYGITAIVTEYCETNLAQILEINKLKIEQVYALAYQLLKGLLLMQEKGKSLRYIEPEKIFYSASNNQFLLSYLSFTRLIHSENNEQQQGNLNYQSPEVIDKKKPYTITADIFSIGVILLEALLQRKLKGMEYLKLKSQSLMSVLPDLLNEQNRQFVTNILSKMVDPDYCKRSQPINILQLLNKLKVDQKHLKLIKLDKNIENRDVQLQATNQQENIQSISTQSIQREQIKMATEKEKIVCIQIDEDEEDIIENQIGQQNVKVEFDEIQNQKTNMQNFEVQQIKPTIEITKSSQNVNQNENLRQIVKEENTENILNEKQKNEQKGQIEKVQKYFEIDEEENFIETQIGQHNMKVEYNETSNQIKNMINGEDQKIQPVNEIIQSSKNIKEKENLSQIIKEENTENISNSIQQKEQKRIQIQNEQQQQVIINEDENQIGKENIEKDFCEIQDQKINMKNAEDQKIKSLKEIIQISPNINANENIQLEKQNQKDIGQNIMNKQIILSQNIDHSDQIQKDKSNFEEYKQSLMEIEKEDQQEINLENQTNLHQEKQIINIQFDSTQIKKNKIQKDKLEQEIMSEILLWIQIQNSNIAQNYQIILEDKEVQNSLNKLIQYLKYNSFHAKSYNKNSQRVLKIVDTIKIPQQDQNYEIIDIKFKNNMPSEDEIIKIGKVLQKCISIEQISLDFNNIDYYFNSGISKQKCFQQLIQKFDKCDNLSSLSLNVSLDIEGERQLGKWFGLCRNLLFLNLKLTLTYSYPQTENVVSNIIQGLFQCINLVYIDLSLRYQLFLQINYSKSNLFFQQQLLVQIIRILRFL